MTTFSILHATDFHIAATTPHAVWPGAAIADSLRATMPGIVANAVNQIANAAHMTSHDPAVLNSFCALAMMLRKNLDAIMLTGDLATTGEAQDLTAASDLFTQPTQPSLAWARDPDQGIQVMLLPGNHDRYVASSPLYSAGGTEFDAVFSQIGLWPAGARVHVDHLTKDGVTLSVIKSDFSLLAGNRGKSVWGLPGWLGQGLCEAGVLDELRDATEHEYKTNNNPVVWAIHFDPHSTDRLLELLDSHKLYETLNDLHKNRIRVPAIFCGHTHETKVKAITEYTNVYACGTTSQLHAPQGNDCQRIDIEVSGRSINKIRRTLFRYLTSSPKRGFAPHHWYSV